MTAYPAWTPASRPGIVPLHPLAFGTILGRSFTALRQNPKVLLAFAIGVQALGYLAVTAGVGVVAFWAFSRLDTVQTGTDDWDALFAGSIALAAIAGIVLSLLVGALTAIVQGVVVAEVAHEVIAEKLTLGRLWQRVKPVAWRLIGYAALVALGAAVAVGIVVGVIALIWMQEPVAAIVLTVLAVLGAIPLVLWLSTKLLLTPAVIVIEHTTIRGGIARSWTLVRGRFWPALGISVLISVMVSVAAQAVSVPFSLVSWSLGGIFAPTSDPTVTAAIGSVAVSLIGQVVVLLLQSVGTVVQATAGALIYVDCRMRREGLDLDLLEHVERRDAGATDLPDPYTRHPGRIVPRAPQPVGYGYPQGYPPPGYVQPGYPQPGYPQPGYPQPGYPQGYPAPAPPPDATRWAAPGGEEWPGDPSRPDDGQGRDAGGPPRS